MRLPFILHCLMDLMMFSRGGRVTAEESRPWKLSTEGLRPGGGHENVPEGSVKKEALTHLVTTCDPEYKILGERVSALCVRVCAVDRL